MEPLQDARLCVQSFICMYYLFEPHNSVFHTADCNSLVDLKVNIADLEIAYFLKK